jgi:hypothetical protein
MFLKLVGNIFASREANFVSATMFPWVGKHGNIRGNIENLVNVTATMFSSLPRALDSNQEQLRRIQPCISPAHTSMSKYELYEFNPALAKRHNKEKFERSYCT